MSPQRRAADAALVDLVDRPDELDEHDIDLLVDLLGLTVVARRTRR
ncbi:MAG TPA: hypothetical protein VFM66_04920 [Agromyces sp.]|nr:hypothetical protein [Agromyces sp.]